MQSICKTDHCCHQCYDLSRAVQKLKSVGMELLKEKRERRVWVGGGSWFIGEKQERNNLDKIMEGKKKVESSCSGAAR